MRCGRRGGGRLECVKVARFGDDAVGNDRAICIRKPAVVRAENCEVLLVTTKSNDGDKPHSGCRDKEDVLENDGFSRVDSDVNRADPNSIDTGSSPKPVIGCAEMVWILVKSERRGEMWQVAPLSRMKG
jgi:hypothetical protein